ncbi:hypothetical protein [Streptomyces sp. NBC_00356]|uniref:hypothetical protein n=1 Tax=Streptomyces sp. NBC_00356 TaxID=2975724 RepID=UPI002E2578B7
MKSTHATTLAPTPDPLLDVPLPRLLAEYGVELVDSSITDATFFGYYLERKDGHRILAMPRGRSDFEHDTAARMLLADGLGLPSPRPTGTLELSRF